MSAPSEKVGGILAQVVVQGHAGCTWAQIAALKRRRGLRKPRRGVTPNRRGQRLA